MQAFRLQHKCTTGAHLRSKAPSSTSATFQSRSAGKVLQTHTGTGSIPAAHRSFRTLLQASNGSNGNGSGAGKPTFGSEGSSDSPQSCNGSDNNSKKLTSSVDGGASRALSSKGLKGNIESFQQGKGRGVAGYNTQDKELASAYGINGMPLPTIEPGDTILKNGFEGSNFPDTKFHSDGKPYDDETGLRNEVQLSAYGTNIGGSLKELYAFMQRHLEGAVGGLHLLPIYPSSGDSGFAPVTYQEVDPEIGTWDDIAKLARKYDLCLEFMVNHISPASDYFQDFLEKGDKSGAADMFVDWDKFWGPEGPSHEQLKLIRTRNPKKPCLEVRMADGSTRHLWVTFSPQQIDINPYSAAGQKFVEESLRSLCKRGASLIRVDAFGYVTKKKGTRCFFEEPEVWQLLEWLESIASEYGTKLLCEVHEEYQTNIKLAQRGYWVYDFSLPLLILHAFHFQTAANLRHWLSICPSRQITVLDTHDGMGIDDISGLAEVCDVEELKEVVGDRLGCNPIFKYYYDESTGGYTSSPHQYNCTYFSAMKKNARDYLLARAIQFFTPGIPMVYYVGLLAGSNDFDAAELDNNPRAINRHAYTIEEAEAAMRKPVVQALLDLCRFRNRHPAFNGEMTLNQDAPSDILEVTWRKGRHTAKLAANLRTMSFAVLATPGGIDESVGQPIDDSADLHKLLYSLDEDDDWVDATIVELGQEEEEEGLCLVAQG